MYIADRFSALPGGAPVPAGTLVTAKLLKDGSTFLSANTDADGFAEFQANGSPGQLYLEATVGGETRRVYGSVSGQILTWFQGELPQVLAVYGDGYLSTNPHGTAAVSAGTGLTVVVAGGALLAQGVLGTFYTPTTLAIAANASGSTRIDRVVYRSYRSGVDLGKTEVAVKTGTTAAPALQQDTDIWEVSLATVSVPNGAGALVGANITDTRVAVTAPLGDGTVTATKLDVATVTEFVQDVVGAEIVPGVGLTKTYNDTAGTVTLDTALTTKSGATTRVAKTAALSFDSGAFAVTAAGNQATIGLIATPTSLTSGEGTSDGTITGIGPTADTRTLIVDDVAFGITRPNGTTTYVFAQFGTTAGRIAEGSHQHNPRVDSFASIGARTLSGSVSGQSPVTINFVPGVIYVGHVKWTFRAFASNSATIPVNGAFTTTVGGVGQTAPAIQYDAGVDSTVIVRQDYTTGGGSTLTFSWGFQWTDGVTLSITGASMVEWDFQPVR